MSNVHVESRLYDAIGDGFANIEDHELGSEQRKTAFKETMDMVDRAIELDRIESEREEKAAALEQEKQMKERQMKFEKGKMVAEFIVGGLTLAANMLFTRHMFKKSVEFEKTDTFTSTAGRNINNRVTSWLFKK